MGRQQRWWRASLVLAALAAVALSSTGCGYLKNVRDDVMDVGTLAVGIVPPVVPTDEPQSVGLLPPAIGAYVEVTEFFHLGALFKATGDLEWDRRGIGVMVDTRTKLGLGPLHHVYIKQEPVLANAYKIEGNELDGWRQHMRDLADPVFGEPAKVLIYKPVALGGTSYGGGVGWEALPFLSRGWQDWEMVSLEVAIPEPFITHSGFYARVGVDVSQVFDLVLSVFLIDLYDDAAYNFDGSLQHP